MSIIMHGTVSPPESLLTYAEGIKFENYKTNTPKKFQKHEDLSVDGEIFKKQLGDVIGINHESLDWVFFSVCEGAEPHVDILDDNKFTDTTYVVPIILPKGVSRITAEEVVLEVDLNKVYEFDHTKTHSMILEDTNSGCVVVMAAVLKQ